MLVNQILPEIQNIPGTNFNDVWFQDDEVSPHYAVQVKVHFLSML